MDRPARVAIIGSGNVTHFYLTGAAKFPSVALVACADLDPERARALAARGGFPAVPVEAILGDTTIDVALVLTPPAAHAPVAIAAIEAGKHVYSEKPLATSREDARLVLDAAAAAGVRVGAAPDTFLGGGLQTARAVIDDGLIGTPLVATAAVSHTGPERWHHDPRIFYAPGGGPVLDVGPYYVTALVNLLGPVAAVAAVGRGVGSERLVAEGPLVGTTITSGVPTTVIGTLTFASGVIGSLFASFDTAGSRVPHIEIHGTAGSLSLGDPNHFSGEVRLRALGSETWEDIPLRFPSDVERGIGLADMVDAIADGRPHRASGELAYHVLDVLLSLEEATRTGRTESVASRVDRPAALE
ncbi:MAG TPA: Gfo/Idh/MocA family oxidoreductase [Candidatus Limnocylindrales bacterium]|nr:Gfo/Idh/MocA family oxidoreductase [Candidatus Limnocylindrales bacterium]